LSIKEENVSNNNKDTMIHHKDLSKIIYKLGKSKIRKPYGVSAEQRILPPSLLLKWFDKTRDFLEYSLNLTPVQREVTLRLLRLWAYYGEVYPKESQITELPGCSKATFWRTIKKLEEMQFLQRINRFILREKAQISNLYLLDKLILAIARFLHEKSVEFLQEWVKPFLMLPGSVFWRKLQGWRFDLCRTPLRALKGARLHLFRGEEEGEGLVASG
jgi:hypothetical protein